MEYTVQPKDKDNVILKLIFEFALEACKYAKSY